jgi:ABC-2 type transport system ATP-binding protein
VRVTWQPMDSVGRDRHATAARAGAPPVAAVQVDDLHVRYGDVHPVRGVSFTASAGEITVLLGPNGAGKTSTIEVCEGFRAASSGSVCLLGQSPAGQPAALMASVGVMLQEGGVYPGARVAETVRHFCSLYGRGVDAAHLVTRVGLEARRRATWRQLSGGERQRLSLALALAARPDVAFLDEPTSGVDVHGREMVRDVIRELAGSGCAVVVATHELDEAERTADRAVIIDRGQVVAAGTLAELRRGRDEIRFRSAERLDLAELARATGLIAAMAGQPRGGTAEFVIDAPPHPRLMAQLTGWLADHGHPIDDIRGGAQRLEDVFKHLTAGSTGDRA